MAGNLEVQARVGFLMNCSLVAQEWQYPAQKHMWLDVVFEKDDAHKELVLEAITHFATSPATSRGMITKHICFSHIPNEKIEEVLKICKGVQSMVLNLSDLNPSILEAESLAGEWSN